MMSRISTSSLTTSLVQFEVDDTSIYDLPFNSYLSNPPHILDFIPKHNLFITNRSQNSLVFSNLHTGRPKFSSPLDNKILCILFVKSLNKLAVLTSAPKNCVILQLFTVKINSFVHLSQD